ncbi:MAG: acyl-CoA thioesterase [Acidobacteria bacterium]|nr:acyl-CoA thioesterase [Acidobacteriota bacterium]
MPDLPPPFLYPSRIRFVDTDASQRIHYTAMFRHFEAAEMEWLRAGGCPYSDSRMAGVTFPRVHVECDFQAELRFDDLVTVALTVERIGTSSFTMVFAVSSGDRQCARGKIVVVCIDRGTQRPCPIPSALLDSIQRQLAK